MNKPTLRFLPLEESHLNQLCLWLNKPHVKTWWDDHLTDDEIKKKYGSRIGDNCIVPFLVYLDQLPLGFIQYYQADKVGGGWWPEAKEGTVGIDQFIGDEAYLNRGFGTALISAFVEKLFSQKGIQKIIVDVDPDNHRAIRCYEKCGFQFVKEVMTPDGRAYLYEINNVALMK